MSSSGAIAAKSTFKLSPQQFGTVLTTLQEAAALGGNEMRQAMRMNVQAPVRLAVLADKKITHSFIAVTRDISWSGIGLCQHQQVKPFDEFLISFPCVKGQIVVHCIVTFCRAMADGIYSVGGEFMAIADAELVEQFKAAANEHDRLAGKTAQ